MHDIEKSLWETCKLCNGKIKDLAKKYGGSGVYFNKVFKIHLKQDHDLRLEEYFERYCSRPICKCNICKKACLIGFKGAKLYWKEYSCGRYPGQVEWSKKAKITRRGAGNPMFGKKQWNNGLNKNTHSSLMSISLKHKGKFVSEETKKKQSKSAKNRKIHGHTGIKHSDKSKELMRQKTINRIKNGLVKQTKTGPCLIFKSILENFNIRYQEERQSSYWLFDFYLVDYDIYIEIDGYNFHSNPIKWPDGPKSKTQKKNWLRDKNKNKYCKDNGLHLERFWEYDINNKKEEVVCRLKKLCRLNLLENKDVLI